MTKSVDEFIFDLVVTIYPGGKALPGTTPVYTVHDRWEHTGQAWTIGVRAF